MHTKMPKFQLAHLGSGCISLMLESAWCYVRLFFLQSAQLLLDSSLTRLFSVALFCSTRLSAAALLRDMVAFYRPWADTGNG